MKPFRAAADLAQNRMDGLRSVEHVWGAASKTKSDEVYEYLQVLVDGAGGCRRYCGCTARSGSTRRR
jgi:hypothetical protein